METTENNQELERLEAELKGVEAELNQLDTDFENGRISREEYNKQKAVYEATQQTLQEGIKKLKNSSGGLGKKVLYIAAALVIGLGTVGIMKGCEGDESDSTDPKIADSTIKNTSENLVKNFSDDQPEQPIDPTDGEGSTTTGSEKDPAPETPEGEGGNSGLDFEQMGAMASDTDLTPTQDDSNNDKFKGLLERHGDAEVILVPEGATSEQVKYILEYGSGTIDFGASPFGIEEAEQANKNIDKIIAINCNTDNLEKINTVLNEKNIILDYPLNNKLM